MKIKVLLDVENQEDLPSLIFYWMKNQTGSTLEVFDPENEENKIGEIVINDVYSVEEIR